MTPKRFTLAALAGVLYAAVAAAGCAGCGVTEREARYGVGATGCAEGYPTLETSLECVDHLDRSWGVGDAGAADAGADQ